MFKCTTYVITIIERKILKDHHREHNIDLRLIFEGIDQRNHNTYLSKSSGVRGIHKLVETTRCVSSFITVRACHESERPCSVVFIVVREGQLM